MINLTQDTDESLMVRIQRGDHQAFATLVRRHTDRFYGLAYRSCGDQNMAEDIVQEAFMKLWNKPQSWKADKGAKFTTWFYRVVVNQAHDFTRRKKAEYGADDLDIYADERAAQDVAMQQDEEQAQLESAIAELPERQRDALNLCFYEGLSNKEAAVILGVGVKALESLLMRAKKGLKDELARAGFIQTGDEQERKYGQAG